MKTFVVVISIWGHTGQEWVYTGNQYIMQETFTQEQCNIIVDNANWQKYEENQYYGLQLAIGPSCIIKPKKPKA